MRILIINLANEKQRLSYQTRQFEKLGLKFERFEAITPQTLPEDIPETYWQTWERPLRPEERACFLSHQTIWKSIVKCGEPALILEDDVLLSKNLQGILSALDKLGPNPTQYLHLNLEVTNRKKLVSRRYSRLAGKLDVLHLYQDRNGAGAYILWPKGAAELIKQTQNRVGLADAIICRTYSLRSLQVEPACAVQFVLCGAYGITPPFETVSATNSSVVKTGYTFSQFLSYRSKRIASQLRMGVRRLSKALSGKRRYINLSPDDFKP